MIKMLSQAPPEFLLLVALSGKEGGYYSPYVGRWQGNTPYGWKHTLSRCLDAGVGGGQWPGYVLGKAIELLWASIIF